MRPDAHIYLAVNGAAYGFVISERFPGGKQHEAELARIIGASLPEGTDNFTATLIAARHAATTARELGEFRCFYFHTNERSICARSACIPHWRKTGVFLASDGKALKKEAEWQRLVEAIEGATVTFLHAAKFTFPRKRIAGIKALISSAAPSPEVGAKTREATHNAVLGSFVGALFALFALLVSSDGLAAGAINKVRPITPPTGHVLKGLGADGAWTTGNVDGGFIDGPLAPSNIPILDINTKTTGILAADRGGAGSVLGLLQANGNGLVSSANLLDFTGDAYAWQYPNIDASGVTDSTAGIQAMIDATNTLSPVQKRGAKIVFGPGRFALSGPVVPGGGQTLQGASQYRTTFVVDSATFDMNSVGVMQLPFGDSTTVSDIGFEFVQPNTPGMTRNDVIKYPPAIVGSVNSTRPVLDRIRVVNGYGCVHLVGNVGGANIGEVGCSTLAKYNYARFTASASGMTLTVPTIVSGAIQVPGNVYHKSGPQLTLYRVVSQLTGLTGQAGTYQLGVAASFGNSDMYQTEGGFVIDGAKDFVKIGRINCVPGLGTTLYPNLFAVYMDRQTNCAAFGEVDGLSVGPISPYAGNIRVTPRAGLLLPYFMGPLQLDVDNADVIVYAGTVRIKGGYSTKSAAQTTPIIEANGLNSRVSVEDFVSQIDDSQSCAFKASGGGQLTLRGGAFAHSHTASNLGCAVGDYSTLSVFETKYDMGNVNRTAAFFSSGATSFLQFIGNHKNNEAPGLTGHAIEILGDQTNSVVKSSCSQNRTHNLPFNTSLGHYDLCEPDTISTPSIAFETPGAAITVNPATTGRFWRKGDHVELEVALDFTTPAATTEAGALGVTISNLPTPVAGSKIGCLISDVAKVVFASQWFPFIEPSNPIRFRQLASGAAGALMGVAAFPPGISNFVVNFNCPGYPVR